MANSGHWGWLTGIRPAKLMSKLLSEGLDDAQALAQMQALYEVSPERAEICLKVAKAGAKVTPQPNDIAIYIGVPFCPSRCVYCSFVSSAVGKTGKLMKPFIETLEYELSKTAQTIKALELNVIAVYIGGGTPTALPLPLFQQMLEITAKYISFAQVAEYTVEAGRADTITPENIALMKQFGVNRISVNPQSMNARTLELIGREHTVEDVCKAFDLASSINTVNMDVIAGLPGENAGDFEHTLSSIIALQPQNITVHTMARKKGSSLSGYDGEASQDISDMIDYSLKALTQAGFSPYYLYRQKFMEGDFENIGWSTDTHDSLYNIIMMEEKISVLALGGGGVTRLVHPKTRYIDRAYNQKYAAEYNNSQLKIDSKQQFVIDFYINAPTHRSSKKEV